MEWLNYHHLLYFSTVAREGCLARAGRVLRLSHSTLSGQIHTLEDQLGEKLFTRAGRKLALTEMGRVVYRYAEEIFALGTEMLDTVKGRRTGVRGRRAGEAHCLRGRRRGWHKQVRGPRGHHARDAQ